MKEPRPIVCPRCVAIHGIWVAQGKRHRKRAEHYLAALEQIARGANELTYCQFHKDAEPKDRS